MTACLICIALALTMPAAALAQDGAQVPAGSNLTLFALGVAGILIGRYASRLRNRD